MSETVSLTKLADGVDRTDPFALMDAAPLGVDRSLFALSHGAPGIEATASNAAHGIGTLAQYKEEIEAEFIDGTARLRRDFFTTNLDGTSDVEEIEEFAQQERRNAAGLRVEQLRREVAYSGPLTDTYERLAKGAISRRFLPGLAVLSALVGTGLASVIPSVQDDLVVEDPSFLPGDLEERYVPDWLDFVTPPGFDDTGYIAVTTRYVDAPAEEPAAGPTPEESTFSLSVSTQPVGTQAVVPSSPSFELTGREEEAFSVASEEMLDQLSHHIADGCTVSELTGIGLASDEAGTTNADIGVRNSGNERAANARMVAGGEAWEEALVKSQIRDGLPSIKLTSREVILTDEAELGRQSEIALLTEIAIAQGYDPTDFGPFMIDYKSGALSLSAEQTNTMAILIDNNRGFEERATVTCPLEDQNQLSERDSEPSQPETKRIQIEEEGGFTSLLSSNKETQAAFLGGYTAVFGLIAGITPLAKIRARFARHRARKELGIDRFSRLRRSLS